jgi:predicted transport protein
MLLNRAIEDALRSKNEATRKQILAKLPLNYVDFVNVFSKSQNNELPSYRPLDHKIELLPDATPLRAHSLYSMSTEQLVALKEYLTENFQKKWIVSSSAKYGFPVLFAKKPNSGLRLYMNYRELNARTRKNTYLLHLIKKTLKRINRARVYIKLNIR